jgi:hypothetical protein
MPADCPCESEIGSAAAATSAGTTSGLPRWQPVLAGAGIRAGQRTTTSTARGSPALDALALQLWIRSRTKPESGLR